MSLRQLHVVALLAVLLTAGPALAQGRWSQMKPIPQGEEEVVGVALDGRMYVLGGLGAFPGWSPSRFSSATIRPRTTGAGCPPSPRASTTRASLPSAARST